MSKVADYAQQVPKTAIHYAVNAPRAAEQGAIKAPRLANQRARSFAKAMHRPSYARPTDPEQVEKGMIGAGKPWRVRNDKEMLETARGDDEETVTGSDGGSGSGNGKEMDERFNFPLTLTKKKTDDDGKEFIVLGYAEGDKEDPQNWSRAYKWYTTYLLCTMTLFIVSFLLPPYPPCVIIKLTACFLLRRVLRQRRTVAVSIA